MQSAGDKLLGLGLVIVVAVGAVLLLLRLNGRDKDQQGVPLGYPPDLYPAQDLVGSGPLAALAATQARLMAIYSQLPAQSDMAIWLRAFLNELREIMDTTYRVALITQIYGTSAPLDRLVSEVEQIEVQVVEHVAQRLLARGTDADSEFLDGRLATLRLCVCEIASLADAPAAAPS